MKIRNLIYGIVFLGLLWSCGKDDGPTPAEEKNKAPKIEAQSFSAAETITDEVPIGTVKATDEDQDELTFSITVNDENLFEITDLGVLSLASGKSLDATVKQEHVITVGVDDGEDSAEAQVTIKVTLVNQPPSMEGKEVTVKEDITEEEIIATMMASDGDGDALVFSIEEDIDGLFTINDAGELKLAQGKSLDYETKTAHVLKIKVDDGKESTIADLTITVENIIESMAEDPDSFVTTWKTETNGEKIIIGAYDNYEYDFTIDWGDGTVEDITEQTAVLFEHTYASAGTYKVAIQGDFPSINMYSIFVNLGILETAKLVSLDQWGSIVWQRLYGGFSYCVNMVYNASDAPNLSECGNISRLFAGATSFNGDLSNWDTHNVNNMAGTFREASSFNGDISTWDTANVITMFQMFKEASVFDQDLGGWEIKSVASFNGMLDNSGMSSDNLNATLIGWADYVQQNNAPLNVQLGIDNLTFCGQEALGAATKLITLYNWELQGDYSQQCN